MSRILLDTNILIHREARTVVRADIGSLFRWLDVLRLSKVIHPGSVQEIRKHADEATVRTLEIKLGSYTTLKTTAPDTAAVAAIRASDTSANDQLDTSLLAELAAGRVDALITEDRGIHRKAALLGLGAAVYTIDSFLEKVTAENPGLADYKVLAVRRELLGNINLADAFFDSFREDYPGFDAWFNRKADDSAYVCTSDSGAIVAFLYLKREGPDEDYSDISPVLEKKSRLKIGTLKVIANGFKLGERFLKIVFDNALRHRCDEIYVTIFQHRPEQLHLIQFLSEWGFAHHGEKVSAAGTELVMRRSFTPSVDASDPRRTFPFVSRRARKFIVPIYPEYHTELLPDSILNTESPAGFVENKPNRNAISKVYVSRSIERNLSPGDIVVFYRTASGGSAYYTSVATTLGVVQEVVLDIPDEAAFIRLCRKRSVFTDAQLSEQWRYRRERPFVVNFLFVLSFPKRPNRKAMMEGGIMGDAPRGFSELSDTQFSTLLSLADADPRIVVS